LEGTGTQGGTLPHLTLYYKFKRRNTVILLVSTSQNLLLKYHISLTQTTYEYTYYTLMMRHHYALSYDRFMYLYQRYIMNIIHPAIRQKAVKSMVRLSTL